MDALRSGKSDDLSVSVLVLTSSFSVSPLDLDLDLDLEQLWEDLSDVPSSPALFASDYDHLFPMEPLDAPLYGTQKLFTPSPIEYIFYPSHDSPHGCGWTGPDPLSPHTSADDIFLFMSAFLLFEQIQWVEFRFCRLITRTGEIVEEYPFFLPRVESILGNLARVRGQIRDIISRQDSRGALTGSHFQLCIWPLSDTMRDSPQEIASPCVRPTGSVTALDPVFFIQNIAGNFKI